MEAMESPRAGSSDLLDPDDLLLDQRLRVLVAFRLGVRLWQAIAKSDVAGRWRYLRLVLGLTVDGLTGLWMACSRRRPGRWRLGLDVFEAAIGSVASSDVPDAARSALMPALNLCIEAGVRGGVDAVVTPAAITGAAGLVRWRRKHHVRPTQAGWPLAASAFGVALRRYLRGRQRILGVEHERKMAATVSQAFRLGQFEASSEADSVIDEAQRALILIQDAGGPQMQAALAAWKASLAAAIRDEGTYLSEVLLRRQTFQNLGSDLGQSVVFILDSEWPVVIGRQQSLQLWNELERLRPHGRLEVRVINGGIVPGQAVTLRLGSTQVLLRADSEVRLQLDLAPLASGYTAVMVAMSIGLDFGAVALPVALFGSAFYLGLGFWAHRRLPMAGTAGRRHFAQAALVAGAIHSAFACRSVRRTRTSGGQVNFPAAGLLQGLAVTLVSVGPALTGSLRVASATGLVAIGVCGWLSLPERPPASQLFPLLVWPLATAGTAIGLTGALDRQVELLEKQFDTERRLAMRTARERGRQWVRGWCTEIATEAIERVQGQPGEDDFTAEAKRRLTALKNRLNVLENSDACRNN